MTKASQVVEYREPIALAGLEEQWNRGDRFALIEAVALCAENAWEYPAWVRQTIDTAMTNMYKAVYPDDDLNRMRSGRKKGSGIGLDVKKVAKRLQRERPQALDLLGLEIEKDNSVNIRRRILRDAYLAELVARRSGFVSSPEPHFKGVGKAQDDLALQLSLDPNDPDTVERFHDECLGASDAMIKRAWEKHKDKIIALYRDAPEHAGTELMWLFSGWEAETE